MDRIYELYKLNYSQLNTLKLLWYLASRNRNIKTEKKGLLGILWTLDYSSITRIAHRIKKNHSASITTPNPNAATDMRSAALRSHVAAPLGPPLAGPPATGLGARVTVTVDVGETAPTSEGPLRPPTPPPLKVVTAVVPATVFFAVVLAAVLPVVWADAAPEVLAGAAEPVGPLSSTPVYVAL